MKSAQSIKTRGEYRVTAELQGFGSATKGIAVQVAQTAVISLGFGLMATQRLRPDGSIILRNNFVGLPLHRVDMRVQKSIAFGHRSLSGIVDVFNLLNRANYGSYTLTETSAAYGKPS